jgi:hypothetical protein
MSRHIIAVALVVAAVAFSVTNTPAYNLSAGRWDANPVQFYVNPSNADVSEQAAISALLAGSSAWSTQSGADISLYYVGTTKGSTVAANGRNEAFFRPDPGSGAIATTYLWIDGNRIIDADVVFNDGSYRFFTGSSGCSDGYYLEDVAAHEFGHALGIAHSDVPSATMVSGTGTCNTEKRTLDPDDMAAVEAHYPPAGNSPAPPEPEPPPIVSAPLAAENPTPRDGQADVPATASLGWASAASATSYDVYFGPTSNPPLYRSALRDAAAGLPKLAGGTTYFWRVVARNNVGETSSAIWRFTTKSGKPGRNR